MLRESDSRRTSSTRTCRNPSTIHCTPLRISTPKAHKRIMKASLKQARLNAKKPPVVLVPRQEDHSIHTLLRCKMNESSSLITQAKDFFLRRNQLSSLIFPCANDQTCWLSRPQASFRTCLIFSESTGRSCCTTPNSRRRHSTCLSNRKCARRAVSSRGPKRLTNASNTR